MGLFFAPSFGRSYVNTLSTDGRYLAILGEVINSNVWMVEGF
jgi:hypothetical protein